MYSSQVQKVALVPLARKTYCTDHFPRSQLPYPSVFSCAKRQTLAQIYFLKQTLHFSDFLDRPHNSIICVAILISKANTVIVESFYFCDISTQCLNAICCHKSIHNASIAFYRALYFHPRFNME